MHVRMIRMPVRSGLSNQVEVQAAQTIKCLGAVPLVILQGANDANVLADDRLIVSEMNQLFGNGIVYYEFGNEEDLSGVTVTKYTTAWNTVIPQLKALALHGQFVGPVNYQYDHNYLTSFLQQANPRPDEISWHEYTCSYKSDASLCLSHLDNWTTHISDARVVMQATLGTSLPIMISEWNYAPDQLIQSNGQPIADGKWDNTSFMTAWTTKAMQVLAQNHIFAAMQYSATNTALPLVASNGTMTTQGATLQALYTANRTLISDPVATGS